MERYKPWVKPEETPKADFEREGHFSRRDILRAALAGAVTALLSGDTDRTGPGQTETPPTPEEINEFQQAKLEIDSHVAEMKKLPFMEKPLIARKQVEQVVTKQNYRSVVLAVEEDGEIKTLHIQDVGELSRSVRDSRGNGIYVHSQGEARYRITLEDSSVDVGVSNRFLVERHVRGSGPQKPVPVQAVRRSRYERKPTPKGGVDEGGYVEYVTYVPPGEHLVTTEVVDSGKEYVGVVLDAAHTILAHRFPKANQKILTLCLDICKRIAIVEHVDPVTLTVAEQKAKDENERDVEERKKMVYQKMYAEYGLNQDKAFNHLINSLGAGGMMQIMQRTYKDIRERLVERKAFLPSELPEDANSGRRDPLISAIIAMYLCYDNYLVRASTLATKRDDEIEPSLVSMYNGSPNLFRKILQGNEPEKRKNNKEVTKKHPPIPYDNPSDFIKKILSHNQGAKLPGSGEPENLNYLRKYVWLKRNEKRL